jgi:hypothetical protein
VGALEGRRRAWGSNFGRLATSRVEMYSLSTAEVGGGPAMNEGRGFAASEHTSSQDCDVITRKS